MKVERVDEVERVKARLQQLSQKRHVTERIIESNSTAHFEKKLDEAEADLEKIKEERRNRKKAKKQQSKPTEAEAENVIAETKEDEEDLMALMGFNSFS